MEVRSMYVYLLLLLSEEIFVLLESACMHL